ncbi:MAG: YebC/PmpR family DNA-binding transcriptional regulator [Candidatus Pacebacteria bacterium]|nr:YebC/PmpR family DNA-binding transcriptional regulator [Candidatus Paceibacterota bacterium]MCF7862415.1 YebC/PmpR family DNA-binding transcriptional regulator [Candidatus Paceibacterota bacterium]
MSGHNKWAQIKRQKAVTDAKRSQIFSKLSKNISVEARLSDGKDSPSLRAAIEKAKKVNMPKDVIERAVKKGSEPSNQMEYIMYEAYGPGGAGIIIETLTDSRNRTAQEIKHLLSKNGFSLAGIGSVSWAFTKENTPQGMLWIPNTTTSLSDEDILALDNLIEEIESNDDVQDVYTNAE